MKNLGQIWERDAERFLLTQGLELLTRNFLTTSGEIDLVMRDHNTIVFVEVRFRKISRFGGAIHSISRRKQSCVMRSASQFLQQVESVSMSERQIQLSVLPLAQFLKQLNHVKQGVGGNSDEEMRLRTAYYLKQLSLLGVGKRSSPQSLAKYIGH